MNSYRIILRTEPDEGITSEAFVFIGVPKDRNTETISWNDILPRTLISRDEFYELFERLHVRWISEKELKYSVTK